MRRKFRNVVLVSGVVLGSLGLLYPYLSGMAQKEQNRNSQVDASALQVVRENRIANSFYDSLQRQEPDWILAKTPTPETTEPELILTTPFR